MLKCEKRTNKTEIVEKNVGMYNCDGPHHFLDE
jgi:hypothetical protein